MDNQYQPLLSDLLYILASGVFAVLVEGFRRYLFGRIQIRLEVERAREEELEDG